MKLLLYSSIILLLLITGCSNEPTNTASQKIKFSFLSEQNPPMSFLKRGRPVGMAVDIVKAIAKELHIKTNIKIQVWEKAYTTALNNPDVILFPAVKNKKREKHFYWIGPIMGFHNYFYCRNDNIIKIDSLNDAKKYKIATVKGFSSEENLIEKGFNNIISYSTPKEALNALMDGKVQLVVSDDLSSEMQILDIGHSADDILPIYEIDESDLYIAISKGTSKVIVREWEDAFSEIKRGGTYVDIYKKWLMSNNLFLYK